MAAGRRTSYARAPTTGTRDPVVAMPAWMREAADTRDPEPKPEMMSSFLDAAAALELQESWWEELWREARKLEGDLDVKLSSYAQRSTQLCPRRLHLHLAGVAMVLHSSSVELLQYLPLHSSSSW